MASDNKTVLIVGASGVIGASAVEHFAKLGGWRVIGASRRPADVSNDVAYEHVTLDLRDAEACERAAAGFAGVTHVIYTALFELPGLIAGWQEQEQMTTNLAMIRNLMDPLRAAATKLEHVSVLQGTKAYGVHVHGIKIPCRENRPRDVHENFYWLQEDYVREAQKADGGRWDFTIWRPQIVFGGPTGVAMNLIPIIGAYAAICREEGLPFACPASVANVMEAVDADLIAKALAWAAEAPAAKHETFNITNGDVFVWQNVWPAIAEAVGLEPVFSGGPALSRFLPEHSGTWDRIVAKHNLRPVPMDKLVGESHHYADFIFAFGAEVASSAVLVSTTKLRQAGFGECVDTEVMFKTWLQRIADRGVIPQA